MESEFSLSFHRIGIHMTSASFFFISVSALMYTISWQKSFECLTTRVSPKSHTGFTFIFTNKLQRNEFQSP
jgi:hypothetical protein